jgi:CBS domain-containing protein/anti-sigma regulatory factor (Ser/Thr protein kinase)
LNNFHDSQSKLIIEDMMSTCVITVSPEMTMREAKEIMRLKNISGMPVIDDKKKLIGIVTIADVIQALDDQKLDEKVKDRMTLNVCTVKPYDSINLALSLFRRYQYSRLPVVNDTNLVVGIITPNDIVKRLANFLKLDEINEAHISNMVIDETHTLEFEIKGGDFEKAGLAASSLKKKLLDLGINAQIVRRAAIAAYEAEMNVVIHAVEGILKAQISPEKLLLFITDQGPGIEDIEKAMQIGYSTAPDQIREMGFGAGMGLPNIKKSSDIFKINSTLGKGTELHIEIFF